MPERKTVAEATVNFHLPKPGRTDEFIVKSCLRLSSRKKHDCFVRLSLQVSCGCRKGTKLSIFDHRPEVVRAVQNCQVTLNEEMLAVLTKPARMVVRQNYGFYLNFYPADQPPTALLYLGGFFEKREKAGFSIEDDRSLWSWMSVCGIPSRPQESIVAALTNEDHPLVIRSWGHANGWIEGIVTIAGRDIVRRPWSEH